MSEAPRTIFLSARGLRDGLAVGKAYFQLGGDDIEYLRADAARQEIERLRVWLEESIKTMELCREQRIKVAGVLAKAGIIPDDDSCKISDEAFRHFIENARAALENPNG